MQSNIFRLFISSTFSDFKKEREVLHTRVFPRIDKYCKKQGYSFQPIDLRWGVNNEAQLDQKTLEVCLEEVKACKHFPHPNFFIMAGDRYGYIPLPYMIEKKEFEKLLGYIRKNDKPITITYKPQKDKNKKIISHKQPRQTKQLELLGKWYKEDKNQIPLEDKKSTAYILQPRREEYTIYENWEPEENALREILQEAATKTIDKSIPAYQKYFTSATEAEAIEGIKEYGHQTSSQKERENAMDKDYVFGYVRTIANLNGDYVDQEESLQSRAKTFKDNLRKTLLEQNIYQASYVSAREYESGDLEAFEEYYYDHIKSAIDKQKEQTDSLASLQKELVEQQKFKNDKLKGFLGREKTLSSISNYLDKENTKQPFVIYGPSGMGKSSLMAKSIEEAEQSLSDTHMLYRFVGATPGSTTLKELLTSICDELQEKKIIAPIESYESDENKFQTQIKEALSSIKEPTSLFIDALDQLQRKDYLQWLPELLPKELKIVFTVLKDSKYEEDSHYFNLFETRLEKTQLFDITQDSLEPQKEELLASLLFMENRRLQEDQKSYVLKQWQKAHYSPLYLKIAIEEIKNWSSYGSKEKQNLSDGTEGIIKEFIGNLSRLYHHEPILVDKVFGYIHASKDGLSEKELLEILSEDLEDEETFKKAIINDYHEPIKTKNPRRENKEELMLPLSVWSRLHTHIKPFLVERNIDKQPLMKFFHRQFTTVVEEHIKQNKKALHVKLGEYFSSLQDNTKTWDERYHNVHMLTELPYQYYMAEYTKKLKEILFDLEFAGSVYDNHKQTNFQEILEKASSLKDITEDEIYPWESFYREKEHLITRVDEELWRPHQSLFQIAYEDGLDSPLTKEAERLLEKDRVHFHWLKRRNRPEEYSRSGLIRVLEGHKSRVNGIMELSDGKFLSWSNDSTLRVWNREGMQISRMLGHTGNVYGAIKLRDKRLASWAYGDKNIMLWSITGKCLNVLKGHTETVNGAQELKNGNIVSYSADKTLRLWDKDGNELCILEAHKSNVGGVIELDNKKLLSWGGDLRIWSEHGEVLQLPFKLNEEVSGAIKLSRSRFLFWSKNLWLWNDKTKSLDLFAGHNDLVNGAMELSDGRLLSWSRDKTLIIWSSKGELLKVCEGHVGWVNGAIELACGTFVSWSNDKAIIEWNKNGEKLAIMLGHVGRVKSVKELDNQNLLSSALDDYSIRLWDKKRKILVEIENTDNGIVLSNANILSSSSDKTVRIWKIDKSIKKKQDHLGFIGGALKLKDGNILSWAYNDKTLRIFDNMGKEITKMDGHTNFVYGAIELSNGNLLSWSPDKTLRIWSRNGKCLNELVGHNNWVIRAFEVEDGIISEEDGGNISRFRKWSLDGQHIKQLNNYKINKKIKKTILSHEGVFEIGSNKFYSATENFEIFEIFENTLIAADGRNLILSDFYIGLHPLFSSYQPTQEP